MKKIIFIVCFLILLIDSSYSQILPANRYFYNNHLLDLTLQPASFAYSFRKLRTAYTGAAIKIRRGTDNAEADVAFDIKEVVSQTSIVTIKVAGTSGLIVGQTMDYLSFIGSQTIYVSTWYDQSKKVYDAIQVDNTLQPRLVLNTSGSSNSYPSVLFDGARRERLIIGQPIERLTNLGVNATYMTVLKATENSKEQLSFGLQDSNLNRWSLQTNWTDDNLYFDAADGITINVSARKFQNDFNLYFYKQYSFVRGSSFKTARFNQTVTSMNNLNAPSTPFSGGSFGIGYWYLNCCLANPGFYGNVTEIVMFPTDLLTPELTFLEQNQITFWQL
jgi:hypothetical protein